ncbi:MAG: hypothetical protein E7558_00090 [Ruminococcaceae bacterium]|nr:hypothetical protein [Oscillospiraceae bacterium]
MTVKVQINGEEHSLTLNSSTGLYETTVTAPSSSSYNNNAGHYFPVAVTVRDEAGNSASANDTHATLGNSLKLYVKEKIKPTVKIVSPTAGANITTSSPQIVFELLDNSNGQTSGFSGIDINSLEFKVDGAAIAVSKVTHEAITGGYRVSYTPTLDDGNHNFTVNIADFDGNTMDSAVSTSFKVDTAPPTLNVSAPVEGEYTNNASYEVKGETSDATSSPVTVAIKVGSTDQGTVTVATDGSFSKKVTLVEGVNTITVIATDSAGKVSTVTRTIILKTDAPVIKSVRITPNPVDGGTTYTISVEVE